MQQITKRGKYAGDYTVYESKQEAVEHGVPEGDIAGKMESRRGVIARYFLYDDGWVAPVLRFSQGKRNWFITTPLGEVNSNSKTVNHVKDKKHDFERFKSKVTYNRIAFLNGWLFQGLSVDESARKFLQRDLLVASRKLRDDLLRDPRREGADRKTFQRDMVVIRTTYLILSWPWFDTLMSENRIMADRYNRLIGSFEHAGLTYQYLASYIKQRLEGKDENGNPIAVSEKERISAFNKFADMLIAAELKQPQQNPRELPPGLISQEPQEARFTAVPPSLPTNLIEEESNGNNTPEGAGTPDEGVETLDEATLARISETEGDETVLVVPPVEQRMQSH